MREETWGLKPICEECYSGPVYAHGKCYLCNNYQVRGGDEEVFGEACAAPQNQINTKKEK